MDHAISKNALEAVISAACPEATRGPIHGVRISPNRIETTDGHRLHRVTFAEPIGDGSRTVTTDSAKAAAKLHGKSRNPMQLNGAWNVGDGATLPVSEIEGDWPNTDAVLPKAERATVRLRLNTRFLRDACAAAERMQEKQRNAFIVLEIDAEEAATRPMQATATGDDGAEFLAVIMPAKL